MRTENQGKKNFDIEALRSVAILTVLFAHLHNYLPYRNEQLAAIYKVLNFWGGVDLFFCVSGFVIMKSLQGFEANKQHSFASLAIPFWVKRAFRLWPAAWFWLSFLLVASVTFNSSGVFGDWVQNLVYQVYAMFHLANIYGFSCRETGLCGANLVYWSLSLEEQFYLVFPFLLFFVPRKWLVPVLLSAFAWQFFQDRGGFLGFIRTDAILAGVLIAIWSKHPSYESFRPTFLGKPLASISFLFLLTLALGVLGQSHFGIVYQSAGFIAILSGVMVWAASYGQCYLVRPGLGLALASYIGSRSYSLYLTHIPAAMVGREIMFRVAPDSSGFVYLAIGVIITALFTEFSYKVIEEPMRKRGRDLAAKLSKGSMTDVAVSGFASTKP